MEKTVQIIPAVLAKTEQELKDQLEKILSLSEEIHIDFADGKFVKDKTIDWQLMLDLPHFYPDNLLEMHLMCKDPLTIAEMAADSGFQRVIVHVEALTSKDREDLENLTQYGDVSLAFNPETPINQAKDILPLVQGVTLLTVKPGRQGNPFNEDVLKKVSDLKQYSNIEIIELDGGVNQSTAGKINKDDVHRVVVGSALLKSDDPKKVYQELEDALK